jgi:glucose/arabinose dehydrogenase
VREARAAEGVAFQDAFPGATFENPVCVASPDDGSDRVFVAQRGGKVLVFKKWRGAGPAPTAKTFLDISALQSADAIDEGQGGLLTLAFHPQYKTNGRFFVFYGTGKPNPNQAVVASYKASASDPDKADPASAAIVLKVDKMHAAHYGGGLAFGGDGKLYVGLGDTGMKVDPATPKESDFLSQDMRRIEGKVLRLDVDSGGPYQIPSDNPWATAGPGVRGEIWAYGCRNPWRLSFDKKTGTMWLGDPGQQRMEEIDVVPRAANLGWSIREGSLPLTAGEQPRDYVKPAYEYGRDVGRCAIGGIVYRGQRCPTWKDHYVFSDYTSNKVFALPTDGTKVTGGVKTVGDVNACCSINEDASGELYFCDLDDNRVLTMVPAP